jgi:chromosome segregation ATPase
MDLTLLPISLILNFILLGAFGGILYLLTQRNSRIADLEGSSASQARSLQRELEEVQTLLEGANERYKESEDKLSKLREQGKVAASDWEQARLSLVQERDAESAKLEPLTARLKEAQQGISKTERECLRLRNEAVEARKRMETAEGKASEQIARFEQLEAAYEEKTQALKQQQEQAALWEQKVNKSREELEESAQARARVESELALLKKKLDETDQELKLSRNSNLSLQDELAEARQSLDAAEKQLALQQKLADEAASAGGAEAEQRRKLEIQLVELEAKLTRKEAALVELEAAFNDAEREKPYEAHRHMEWTINHFDPKAITFKFTNEGAKVFFVGVETNFPELRYEFETGHDLPRGDFEARIKLAIKKAEQQRMGELPEEIDMTVLYALHVFPIQFKIRPRAGQKIERVF